MFLQKSNSENQKITQERKPAIYNLMRSYVVHECQKSRMYNNPKDLEREVSNRLAKLLS
jgi:hypothetical protein